MEKGAKARKYDEVHKESSVQDETKTEKKAKVKDEGEEKTPGVVRGGGKVEEGKMRKSSAGQKHRKRKMVVGLGFWHEVSVF